MSRDECVKALARHANIRPLITLTGPHFEQNNIPFCYVFSDHSLSFNLSYWVVVAVWKELQKENTEFFRAYLRTIPPKPFLGTTLFLIAYHLVIALYSFLIRTRY